MRPYKLSNKGPVFVSTDRVATFDVDETLVTHDPIRIGYENPPKPLIAGEGVRALEIYPIIPHIKLLKEFASRDFFIVVWSYGGAQWAREVVEALGLTNYVDLVMSKPMWCVDDKEATDWCMKRTYCIPDPKFMETAKRIMEEHSDTLEALAKGPPCNDPACKDCFPDSKD